MVSIFKWYQGKEIIQKRKHAILSGFRTGIMLPALCQNQFFLHLNSGQVQPRMLKMWKKNALNKSRKYSHTHTACDSHLWMSKQKTSCMREVLKAVKIFHSVGLYSMNLWILFSFSFLIYIQSCLGSDNKLQLHLFGKWCLTAGAETFNKDTCSGSWNVLPVSTNFCMNPNKSKPLYFFC